MLKRYWPTIPLALFLALVLFFEWSLANAPHPNSETNSNQQSSNRPINNDPSIFVTVGTWVSDHHDGIEAAAAILSVIFTVALVGSNIALWRVTGTAANAAKQAAQAASVSADAVTVVERAYVYPVITGHGAIGECISNATVFFLGAPDKDDEPVPETAEVTFKFKNFGKTPAILKTAFVGVGVAPLGARIGLAIPEAVLGVLEETNSLRSEMQIGITRKQAQQIGAYTGHICFEGDITFNDIWDNEHTTEFYFVWDLWVERFNLRWVETKTKQKGERPQNGG
jgi:hypothetical protein